MKKKSKWQQRLEEMVEEHKTKRSGDKVNLHNTDRHWNDQTAMTTAGHYLPGKWIPIDEEKPPYYAPIDILVYGTDEYQNWARLSNGDYDYYAENNGHRIKRHITHWAKREGHTYPKYEPLTMDDLKYNKLAYDLFYQSKEVGDGTVIISKTLLAETLRKACDRNYQPK